MIWIFILHSVTLLAKTYVTEGDVGAWVSAGGDVAVGGDDGRGDVEGDVALGVSVEGDVEVGGDVAEGGDVVGECRR